MTAMPTEEVAGGLAPRLPKRQVAAASVGNLIEIFDWSAYTLLAVYTSVNFFPSGDDVSALLGTFVILAVGFLLRPFAGLILGWIADRVGRRFTLMLTIYGMGAGSLLMAVTPTYEQIGIFAPLLLLLARAVQGICIGGEFGALVSFSMEIAPEGRRGYVSGILQAVTYAGSVVCVGLIAGLSWLLSNEDMTAWGWRVVFAVGALLALAGLWIRKGMHETLNDDDLPESPEGAQDKKIDLLGDRTGVITTAQEIKKQRPRFGLLSSIAQNPLATLRVIGMVLGLTSMTYAWGSYMTTYSATYGGLDPRWGSLSQVTSQLTAMIVSVFFGLLTDKIGRKPCLLISGIGLAVGTPIAFSFINDHPLPLFIMRAVALALVALLTVTATPTFAELFPKRVRASGVGFPYALTVGLIGGTIPLVGTLLKDLKLPSAFPFYLAGLAGISAITYATLKETAITPLAK
jgi:MHS family alpha-ketoglutarate permease-like MFS transporter